MHLGHHAGFSFLGVLFGANLEVLAQNVDKKLPVPDPKSVAKAEKEIKTLFKADYAKKKQADRLALSAKLLKLGKEDEG